MAKEFHVHICARITMPIKVIAENEDEAIELAENYTENGALFDYSNDSESANGGYDDVRERGDIEDMEYKIIPPNTHLHYVYDWSMPKITIKRYEDE